MPDVQIYERIFRDGLNCCDINWWRMENRKGERGMEKKISEMTEKEILRQQLEL